MIRLEISNAIQILIYLLTGLTWDGVCGSRGKLILKYDPKGIKINNIMHLVSINNIVNMGIEALKWR